MFEAAFHGLYSPLIVASGAIKEVLSLLSLSLSLSLPH